MRMFASPIGLEVQTRIYFAGSICHSILEFNIKMYSGFAKIKEQCFHNFEEDFRLRCVNMLIKMNIFLLKLWSFFFLAALSLTVKKTLSAFGTVHFSLKNQRYHASSQKKDTLVLPNSHRYFFFKHLENIVLLLVLCLPRLLLHSIL